MAAPAGPRGLARIIVRVVVDRNGGIEPGCQIPLILPIQSQGVVFGMAGDKHLATILGRRQIDPRLLWFGKDLQIGVGADEVAIERRIAGVRRHELVIEAAQQRLVLVEAMVAIDAGKLVAMGLFFHAIEGFQRRLHRPAEEQGRGDVLMGPLDDLDDARPIDHLLELHQPERRPRDDHAVIVVATHLFEVVIEVLQMRPGRVLRLPIVDAQQIHIHLQRRVGEHPHQLDLGFDLLGHQVEDQYPQRADILGDGPGLRHHEDVLLPQHLGGG